MKEHFLIIVDSFHSYLHRQNWLQSKSITTLRFSCLNFGTIPFLSPSRKFINLLIANSSLPFARSYIFITINHSSMQVSSLVTRGSLETCFFFYLPLWQPQLPYIDFPLCYILSFVYFLIWLRSLLLAVIYFCMLYNIFFLSTFISEFFIFFLSFSVLHIT